jgi:phosphatidylglycerophosphatase A
MDRIIMFIATGAGSGYLPRFPGTWGSLVGIALWFVMQDLPLLTYLGITTALFVVGTLCAGSAEKIVDLADPGIVVIDEIVGQLVILAAAPAHPLAALLGFVVFRILDIAKPFPANWIDNHIHGGLGIMLDDIIAALYGLAFLQLIWYFAFA